MVILYGQILLALSPSLFLILVCGPSFFLFKKKHRIHRIGGFLFLIQLGVAWYYMLSDYDWYVKSPLLYSVQLNGCIQAISAIFSFKFL